MKIGIDCRLWSQSGVGRYIRNLVKQLQNLDQENDYVLFVRSNDYENIKYKILNIKWRVVRVDARWHSFREQWEIPKILNKENLDLVHFPYFNVPIFYNGPFIVTIHDLIINHFPTGRATTLPWPFYQVKRLGYEIILNHTIKNSQKIITVSKATKNEIIDHFGIKPSKIVVTYEGADLNNSNPPASPSQDEQLKTKNYFLYVGNAYPHKNLERLLEVIASIKYQTSDIKLVLVGKQDYFYKRLRRKVGEMGLAKEIIFYGEVNDAELQNLYKNTTALILPSLMEGFGLPALEAMSQGCLVLASDIPVLHEICGEAAIYFNPLDIDEIAEKIKMAITDEELKKNLISIGLEFAEKFSWEKLAKETLKVYNALV